MERKLIYLGLCVYRAGYFLGAIKALSFWAEVKTVDRLLGAVYTTVTTSEVTTGEVLANNQTLSELADLRVRDIPAAIEAKGRAMALERAEKAHSEAHR
jgi:hypothetical protein